MRTIQFHNTELELHFGRYQNNNRLAIDFVEKGTGEPWLTATVNVPDLLLEDNQVIIKNYSENTGILDVLIQEGIVKKVAELQSGYAPIHVCELQIEPYFDKQDY